MKKVYKIEKRQPLGTNWELVEVDEMTWDDAVAKTAAQLVENGGDAVETRFGKGFWPRGWTYLPQFLG